MADPFLEESLDSKEDKSETLGVNTTEFSAIDGTNTVESADTADTEALLNKEEKSEERTESAENSAE